MRAIICSLMAGAVSILSACGGGGGGSNGPTTPTPPVTPTASQIAVASGNNQSGNTGTALTAPITVKVSSSGGTGIAGATVTFAVAQGGGSVNPASATTDASGNAQTTWTLGDVPGTQSVTATASGLSGSPVTITASATIAAAVWTTDGAVFTNADFGGTSGAIADAAVLLLKDGRYRMYFGAPITPATPEGLTSAISVDGVKFTLESGPRIPCPVTLASGARACLAWPFIMRLDDGRVRLFLNQPPTNPNNPAGVYSFTSTDDGVTFTPDVGARLLASATPFTGVTGASIVKRASGGFRMYFSESPTMGTTGTPQRVGSASSTDLVTWTVDPGIRLGPGSTLTRSADHPAAIANDDGSVTLLYRSNGATYSSTSTDGLSFTVETAQPFVSGTGFGPLGDPFILKLANGTLRVYANWGDDKTGTIFTVRTPKLR